MLLVFVLNFVGFVLVMVWVFIDLFKCEKIICLDGYIFFVCKFFFIINDMFLFIIVYGYMFIMVFLCIYYVFKVCNILENFNEMFYIVWYCYFECII